MPKRNSAHPLKKICLNAVARNMDYWSRDYTENFSGKKVLYVISPLHCLPHGLILDLLMVLKEEKLLRRPNVDLLIHPGIDNLDLSQNPTDLAYILGLVGRVCQNLRHLDLSFCEKISQSVFTKLVSSIPQIVCLNLRSTCCTDAVMALLGGHCRELRELDVSWCPVTDNGVSSLCINMDDLQTSTPSPSKLNSLSLMGTNVTETGAMCAIKNLPYLKCLNFTNTCLALERLHLEDLKEGRLSSIKPYQLNALNSDCDARSYVSKDSIDIATALCPHVMKVSAANTNILNECLLLFSKFKCLQELELGSGSDAPIVFTESLVPLLLASGAGLTTLSLAEIPGVDVTVIGACCPNLRSLDLLFVAGYDSLACGDATGTTSLEVEHPFEQLQTLRIVCTETSDIPPSQVRLLLSHSYDIESIYIQRCQTLTDSVITDVLNSNAMSRLNHLELEYCNTVTVASIMSLLGLDNPLCTLKTWWCQGITRQDYDFFQELVRQENLSVKVEWIGFPKR